MAATVKLLGITCEVHTCLTCGIPYTLPINVAENQRKKGGYHYCHCGHSQGWSKEESEEGRIRRERDRLKQDKAYLEDRYREEHQARQQAEKSAAAYKGHTTRLRKRAKAGVCPCCNRSFDNLRRHMDSKHPDFAKDAAE